jgi:hypothetical protein
VRHSDVRVKFGCRPSVKILVAAEFRFRLASFQANRLLFECIAIRPQMIGTKLELHPVLLLLEFIEILAQKRLRVFKILFSRVWRRAYIPIATRASATEEFGSWSSRPSRLRRSWTVS